jgi:hypothetical protein
MEEYFCVNDLAKHEHTVCSQGEKQDFRRVYSVTFKKTFHL